MVDNEPVNKHRILNRTSFLLYNSIQIELSTLPKDTGCSQILVEKFLRSSNRKLKSYQILDLIKTHSNKQFVMECLKRNGLFIVDRDEWTLNYKVYIDFLDLKVDPLVGSVLWELEHSIESSGLRTFNVNSIWNNPLFSGEDPAGPSEAIARALSDPPVQIPYWPHSRIGAHQGPCSASDTAHRASRHYDPQPCCTRHKARVQVHSRRVSDDESSHVQTLEDCNEEESGHFRRETPYTMNRPFLDGETPRGYAHGDRLPPSRWAQAMSECAKCIHDDPEASHGKSRRGDASQRGNASKRASAQASESTPRETEQKGKGSDRKRTFRIEKQRGMQERWESEESSRTSFGSRSESDTEKSSEESSPASEELSSSRNVAFLRYGRRTMPPKKRKCTYIPNKRIRFTFNFRNTPAVHSISGLDSDTQSSSHYHSDYDYGTEHKRKEPRQRSASSTGVFGEERTERGGEGGRRRRFFLERKTPESK